MSDPNSVFDKPAGMPQEEVGRLLPKTKDDGVPVVITLPAGARVGDVINNLIYLPGGRTRTLLNSRFFSSKCPPNAPSLMFTAALAALYTTLFRSV